MTRQEEAKYVEKYRSVVEKYAGHFSRGRHFGGLQDLVQVGHIGLIEALRSGRDPGEPSFQIYFRGIIRRNIIDHIRKWTHWHKEKKAAPVLVPITDLNHPPVASSADNINRKIDLELLLDSIAPREREIVEMYFMDGFTQKEIGEKINRSDSLVCLLLQLSLVNLRIAAAKLEEGRRRN